MKGATLGEGDTLIFGDGERSLRIKEIDNRGKFVKVVADGPDFIRVQSRPKEQKREVTHGKKS